MNRDVGRANLDGTEANHALFTDIFNPFGIAVSVPVMSVTPASPEAFATTPQQTVGPPSTITVTNPGQASLSVSGIGFAGANPGDFLVGANTCIGPIAPDTTCQITVRFAPQGQGPRQATLQLFSNDFANNPVAVALSGAGGPLPAGPPGPTGVAGPTGVPGHNGNSTQGRLELLSCRTVRGHGARRGKKVAHREICTMRTVAGELNLSVSAVTYTISRDRVIYAVGTGAQTGRGREQLVLAAVRRMKPGRYVLAATTRRRHRTVARRSAITILNRRA